MNRPGSAVPEIDQQSLRELLSSDENVVIIDVRTAEEYSAGHIEGAINIPIDALSIQAHALPSGIRIVTACNAGGARSHRAVEELHRLGHKKAVALSGGTRGWLAQRDENPKDSGSAAQPVYLDYNATTPVAPEVLAAMLPYFTEHPGNPSSAHLHGFATRRAITTARIEVASLIGADPSEVIFTGCATEANNLALLGVAKALGKTKRHIVVSAIEHPAIMEPATHLREEGWDITVLPVDGEGRVSLEDVERALRPDTALVSVMHANNEVGTIQPIADISRITRSRGIVLHTDAAQSTGKVAVDVTELGVDLLTIAGHKFYGPKGVGALYVRRGTPIRSVLHGAGQELGLRPGTENVPLIVGLGAAARLARAQLPDQTDQLRAKRDRLHSLLIDGIPDLTLNGHPSNRLPNTLHVSFPRVVGWQLLTRVRDSVSASVGSACHSQPDAVSGVLAAMGFDRSRAAGAVRLSVGSMTTEEDIYRASMALVYAWKELATPSNAD